MGLPRCSVEKNSPANRGDPGHADSIPGSGRSPGGESGNPLQYSCQENPMDRGAWQATVPRVAKSWTQLSGLAHNTLCNICKYRDIYKVEKKMVINPIQVRVARDTPLRRFCKDLSPYFLKDYSYICRIHAYCLSFQYFLLTQLSGSAPGISLDCASLSSCLANSSPSFSLRLNPSSSSDSHCGLRLPFQNTYTHVAI